MHSVPGSVVAVRPVSSVASGTVGLEAAFLAEVVVFPGGSVLAVLEVDHGFQDVSVRDQEVLEREQEVLEREQEVFEREQEVPVRDQNVHEKVPVV